MSALNAAAGDVSAAEVEAAAKAACAAHPELKPWDEFGDTLRDGTVVVSPEIGRNWWRTIARAALLAASKVRGNSRGEALRPRFQPGDRITVQAVVAEVHDFPTNWPIRIVLDNGASETIDNSGSVHFSALRSAPAEQDGGWIPIDAKAKNGEIWLFAWDVGEPEGFYCTEGWYEAGPADRRFYSIQSEEIRPTHYRARLPAPPRSLASGSDGEHQA